MNAPTFCTALDAPVKRYLGKQRALGRGYANEERVLASLRTFLTNAGATDLDQELFDGWCQSFSRLTANVRRNRQRIVRNFCLYRRRTESDCFVPDINRFPRPCPPCCAGHLRPCRSRTHALCRQALNCNARLPPPTGRHAACRSAGCIADT